MDTIYYVLVSGDRLGPLSQGQVQEMVDRDRLAPDDLVWFEGAPDWVPLRKHFRPSDLPPKDARPVPPPSAHQWLRRVLDKLHDDGFRIRKDISVLGRDVWYVARKTASGFFSGYYDTYFFFDYFLDLTFATLARFVNDTREYCERHAPDNSAIHWYPVALVDQVSEELAQDVFKKPPPDFSYMSRLTLPIVVDPFLRELHYFNDFSITIFGGTPHLNQVAPTYTYIKSFLHVK